MNHVITTSGFLLSFSFVFPLAKQRLNGWALGNLIVSIVFSSLFKQMVFTGVQVRRRTQRRLFISQLDCSLLFPSLLCSPRVLKCGETHKGTKMDTALVSEGTASQSPLPLCRCLDPFDKTALFYLRHLHMLLRHQGLQKWKECHVQVFYKVPRIDLGTRTYTAQKSVERCWALQRICHCSNNYKSDLENAFTQRDLNSSYVNGSNYYRYFTALTR